MGDNLYGLNLVLNPVTGTSQLLYWDLAKDQTLFATHDVTDARFEVSNIEPQGLGSADPAAVVGPDGRILESLDPGYHDREELSELVARHRAEAVSSHVRRTSMQ